MDDADLPVIGQQQAENALAALDVAWPPEIQDTVGRGRLLGALLAITESAYYHDLDRIELAAAHAGYATTLATLADHPPLAWRSLLTDRLHRTTVELEELALGEEPTSAGRRVADVATFTLRVAARLLAALNCAALSPHQLDATLDATAKDLALACNVLQQLHTPGPD